jgi:predicted RNA-binding protein with PUA-like domain
MNYWLLLADPKSYTFGDLERDKKTTWDGIAGGLAQKHMRGMKSGDMALVYHTAPDKAVVGMARLTSNPYLDPKDMDGKRVVVDIRPLARLANPVSLASLRENRALERMVFLRIQRIAVSPVSEAEFDQILTMGSGN